MSDSDSLTIPQAFSRTVKEHGDRPAIIDGGEALSYTELYEQVSGAARALIASNISHGDRVAIWAPNIHEWIVAALATHFLGGILVPINTRYKGSETAFILRKSQAKILFTVTDFLDTDYVELLNKAAPEDLKSISDIELVILRGPATASSTSWAEWLAGGGTTSDQTLQQRSASVGADDLCDIMFTSGTTGEPKGVMTTHGQTVRVFSEWANIVGLVPEDRYLVVVPFFHSFGYKAGWFAAFLRGACVLPQAVFDAQAVLRRVEPDQISVLPGPPALYQTMLAQADLHDHDLSSLRLAVTGAAVIPVTLVERMRSELGFETVITGYGLTESTGVVTMCRDSDPLETIAKTSGRPINGVEIRLVDNDERECDADEAGEVWVRGYNVMRGYWDEEEQSKEAVNEEGWLKTGDIGVLNANGYLRISDRKKDMYIVGGFNAYPAEIENILSKHEAIAQVAVIGVPDERLGEVGMAYVVLMPGKELMVDELTQFSRDNMANFKAPRGFEIVDALPMNAAGKVQKFVLRSRWAKQNEARLGD
jgi:acyl-CoA synthetase (AMP-forming)/AMP-acid ligase II